MAEYIYVLLNPAHIHYVKIGRTSRSPAERARELSAVSGVAQPFVVAYEAMVSDGRRAEALVHERLTSAGYRLNPSREFFEISLKDAIAVVDTVCRDFSADTESSTSTLEEAARSPAEIALLGWDHMLGSGTLLQDYKAARSCFERALALGGDLLAYTTLAELHLFGLGTRRNPEEAIRLLREGGDKGFLGCYWELWSIFAGYAIHPTSDDEDEEDSEPFKHPQNADVAFGWYLEGHRNRGLVVRPDNVCSYLDWSHSLIPPGSQATFYGRYSKEMIEEWIRGCSATIALLRRERVAGTARANVTGEDGEPASLKSLMLLGDKFPAWGVAVEAPLRRILTDCVDADLEYFFSTLPHERSQTWVRYFRPHLSSVPEAMPQQQTRLVPKQAREEPENVGWLKRLAAGIFG